MIVAQDPFHSTTLTKFVCNNKKKHNIMHYFPCCIIETYYIHAVMQTNKITRWSSPQWLIIHVHLHLPETFELF